MRILMMTNTYKPIVGGLERSVTTFSNEYRKKGHKVLIVAPEHKGAEKNEDGVVRVPAIQNFNGTDFSVELPIHFNLTKKLDEFNPDIVHSHHPFLIGSTAVRVSQKYKIPLVFTHHTLYEDYTHYVPLEAEMLKKFVIDLSTEYANLCDYVFAPSQDIAKLIKQRGVKTEIKVVPTGIYLDKFACGDGNSFRKDLGIEENSQILGTVGRVALEKNIKFLTKAVIRFLKENNNAHFLVVGDGGLLGFIKEQFNNENLSSKLHCTGSLSGQKLIDAYHAMDVFVFASHSETQGLVLAEAIASSVPVIAVKAYGVNDVVLDGVNGLLIENDNEKEFYGGVKHFFSLSEEKRNKFKEEAKSSAEKFSVSSSVNTVLSVYEKLLMNKFVPQEIKNSVWSQTLSLVKAELKLVKNFAHAAKDAIAENNWVK